MPVVVTVSRIGVLPSVMVTNICAGTVPELLRRKVIELGRVPEEGVMLKFGIWSFGMAVLIAATKLPEPLIAALALLLQPIPAGGATERGGVAIVVTSELSPR